MQTTMRRRLPPGSEELYGETPGSFARCEIGDYFLQCAGHGGADPNNLAFFFRVYCRQTEECYPISDLDGPQGWVHVIRPLIARCSPFYWLGRTDFSEWPDDCPLCNHIACVLEVEITE